MGAKHGVAAAVLCAACVLFAATQIPQPTALEGWRSQEQGLWRAPVVSQAQQELSRVRAEIRADRVLNARVARPIAPPAALRFHQLPQTGREMGMKVFAGNMLCGVGETSCEHPCEAFHTITETESDCKCKCTANPHAFYKDDAVICTCPDAPNYATDEARDMYPYAEGERPEPPAVQEEEAPAAEVEEAGADAEEAGADAAPLPPAEEEEGAGGEAGVDAEGAEVAAEPEVQEREAAPEAVRARPGGLMAKAQQLALPRAQVQAGQGLSRASAQSLQRQIARQLASMGVQAPQRAGNAGYALVPLQGGAQGKFDTPPQGRTTQGMWGGPAMLPPDGDYPGGSSGIDMDGYLAFETGHGMEPYHGNQAPMQEAGIAARRTPTPPSFRRRPY